MTSAATVSAWKTESVFKPALLLMSGRVLAFAATFFIPVVLARVFDRADFGTYKQLFLIHSTVYLIAQIGMASSLYYFLPQSAERAGRYAANSALCLGVSGLACLGFLVIGGAKVSHWLSNAELAAYMPWIGLYLFLTLFSSTLEISMISRGSYFWASGTYAGSDLARAAALIVPALLFRRLDLVLLGAVLVGFLRVGGALFYLRREFGAGFRPDRALLAEQLRYALPFGLAVLVEIAQWNYHHYAVSHRFDPATFAIYAVGCLQIPIVDFVASPTSDVMMVKMRERVSEGRDGAVLGIWHDTTRKLALLFIPLAALLIVAAREIIVLLFTEKYATSVPIFMVWSIAILSAAFQVDGVLRVYAKTRFLLAMNLIRLAMMAGLIGLFISEYYLLGPVLLTVLANLVGKIAALARMKRLLHTGVRGLLPWQSLGAVTGAAAVASLVAVAVQSQVHASAIATLVATGVAFGVTYAAVVWRFNLLTASEKLTLVGWMKRAAPFAAGSLDG